MNETKKYFIFKSAYEKSRRFHIHKHIQNNNIFSGWCYHQPTIQIAQRKIEQAHNAYRLRTQSWNPSKSNKNIESFDAYDCTVHIYSVVQSIDVHSSINIIPKAILHNEISPRPRSLCIYICIYYPRQKIDIRLSDHKIKEYIVEEK